MRSGLPKPEPQAELAGVLDQVGGDRLPDAQRERPGLLEAPPQAERAQPSILVVDGGHPAARGEPHAEPHRLDVLVVVERQVAILEAPGRFFAQHAGGLSGLVALDHSAGYLEVAVRAGEGSRVEPERVIVLGDQGGRCVPRDRVEVVSCRLARGLPVAAPPAEAPQPAIRAGRRRRLEGGRGCRPATCTRRASPRSVPPPTWGSGRASR